MTAPRWPCAACGAPGVRNLGSRGYCAGHLTELYQTVGAEAWLWSGGGVGLPELRRPDRGDGMYEVRCSACSASWVGPAFGRCAWCQAWLEQAQEVAAQRVLRPPVIDPDAADYEPTMRRWADKLGRAVEAGLVDRGEALRAWRSGVGRGRGAAA